MISFYTTAAYTIEHAEVLSYRYFKDFQTITLEDKLLLQTADDLLTSFKYVEEIMIRLTFPRKEDSGVCQGRDTFIEFFEDYGGKTIKIEIEDVATSGSDECMIISPEINFIQRIMESDNLTIYTCDIKVWKIL